VTDILKQAFGDISGGTVLDGATGEGVFIRTLVENLKSFEEVIGIDLDEYTKDAESIFTTENVHFSQMDASRLGFEDETFNTVSLSNSLHHMKEISPCIIELKRVLKPGGHFIIREVHGDIQSEPQFTDMYIHHWVAEIDSAFGDIHNKTFSRQELVDLINGVGLSNVKFYDIPHTDMNPRGEAEIEENEDIIHRYIRYLRAANKTSSYEAFIQRGEELRRRLHQVGVQWEPELIVVGEKG